MIETAVIMAVRLNNCALEEQYIHSISKFLVFTGE